MIEYKPRNYQEKNTEFSDVHNDFAIVQIGFYFKSFQPTIRDDDVVGQHNR